MSEPDRKGRSFGARRILLAVGLILLIAAAVAASRLLLEKHSVAVASIVVNRNSSWLISNYFTFIYV